MEWKKIKTELPPLNKPVLFTDGYKAYIGMLLYHNQKINSCIYAKIEGNLFNENGKTTGNYRELYTEPIFWYPLPNIPHITNY